MSTKHSRRDFLIYTSDSVGNSVYKGECRTLVFKLWLFP